jgi:UDP-N-acetylmuramoyl-tripeptide--D-alanyl-D-alanine ligase
MRLRPVALPGGVLAINDAYNANPPSMRASLVTLASMSGRRIAVIGDMLELGPGEDALHAEVARDADALGLDLIVLVGPRMSRCAAEVRRTEVWAASDGPSLAPRLAAYVGAGDRVLFKGSRGARVERVLEAFVPLLEGRS